MIIILYRCEATFCFAVLCNVLKFRVHGPDEIIFEGLFKQFKQIRVAKSVISSISIDAIL